jgi:diguanylate cyclase (GGDEF)-like protein
MTGPIRSEIGQAHALAEQLGRLRAIGLSVSSGLELRRVFQTLYDECRDVVPMDCFFVALYDEQTQIVSFPFFIDRDAVKQMPARDVRTHPGLAGRVIQRRETLYIPDTFSPPADLGVTIVRAGGDQTRSFLGLPLVLHDRVIGVLSVQAYAPGMYSTDQVQFMEMLATQAAIAVEHSRLYDQAQREIEQRAAAEVSLRRANERLQAQLEEIEGLRAQLQEQAIRDPLTNLFNRRYLEETLEREIAAAGRAHTTLCVVLLDLDHFKQINDNYGHKAGDVVLLALAELLRANTRAGDVACRHGGEEFVVVLPGAALDTARRRTEACLAQFRSQPIEHEGLVLASTFSGGIAAFPMHGATGDQLLRAADQALYRAKQAGRNRVKVEPSE